MRSAGGAALVLVASLHLLAPGAARAQPLPPPNPAEPALAEPSPTPAEPALAEPPSPPAPTQTALAEPPTAPAPALPRVRLAYRAAPGCPDEATFVAALTAQARPFTRAPRSAARVRSLDAEIVAIDGGHAGQLRIREADGGASERAVTGTTCADVFSALTLVTALAIDTGPPAPRPPPPDEPPPSLPPPLPPLTWKGSASLTAGGFFAMAPVPAWGAEPSLEVVPPLRGSPVSVRLGVALAATLRTTAEPGAADFLWIAGRLGLGLWPLTVRWFSLRPALGVDIGVLRGRGFDVLRPRDQLAPWVAVSAGARARAALTTRFALELSGGLLVPITRPLWTFDDPGIVVPIHETPPLGGYLTLGAAITFGDDSR